MKQNIVALVIAYALAVVAFNIAPLFIGSLMDSLGLSETQAGLIATLEMMAMAVWLNGK